MNRLYTLFSIAFVIALTSCGAGGNNQGLEYAPNMYHSIPYEPLTQITDSTSGMWVSSIEDGQGEYYNSNPYNQFKMNVRKPVARTVPRTTTGIPHYTLPSDSIEYANEVVKNPLLSSSKTQLEKYKLEGAALYDRMCEHCHGAKGKGQGSVGKVYGGVPNYSVAPYKEYKEGRIFHVITHGKGRMGAHASQISEEDRWKIVLHVQSLQKG